MHTTSCTNGTMRLATTRSNEQLDQDVPALLKDYDYDDWKGAY